MILLLSGSLHSPNTPLAVCIVQVVPIICAEITKVSKHPNADRLRVCQVHTGEETVQVWCFSWFSCDVFQYSCRIPGGVCACAGGHQRTQRQGGAEGGARGELLKGRQLQRRPVHCREHSKAPMRGWIGWARCACACDVTG